jgi:RNA polymerase sigma-70 factor, ECF subfamily
MLTDEEVVARAQAGEGELFELIFERHLARIERYVRGLGLPDADLEDVVAETFTRAFGGIRSFHPASGTRYVSYLYAIARNLGTDRLREKRRAPEVTFLEDIEVIEIPDESEQTAPLAALLKREQLDRIRAALAMLSPVDQEIIALSYDRDLSSKEIMEVMHKPSVTAVTTHLYKAMKKLRTLVLAGEAWEDEHARERDPEIRTMSAERGFRAMTNPRCREEQKAALLWR